MIMLQVFLLITLNMPPFFLKGHVEPFWKIHLLMNACAYIPLSSLINPLPAISVLCIVIRVFWRRIIYLLCGNVFRVETRNILILEWTHFSAVLVSTWSTILEGSFTQYTVYILNFGIGLVYLIKNCVYLLKLSYYYWVKTVKIFQLSLQNKVKNKF